MESCGRQDDIEVLHQRSRKVVPDLIASSSSAAMVGHQMAAGGAMAPKALWERVRVAITENTRKVLDLSAGRELESRAAFVAFLAGRVA